SACSGALTERAIQQRARSRSAGTHASAAETSQDESLPSYGRVTCASGEAALDRPVATHLAWPRSSPFHPGRGKGAGGEGQRYVIICCTTSNRICRPRRRLSMLTRSSWPCTVRRSASVARIGEKP